MLSMMLEAAIRSLMLGAVAWTALACLRVKNPITRLTVWTGLLYVAIAMPLLVAARHSVLPALPVLPSVPMPLPPSFDAMMSAPLAMPAPTVSAVAPMHASAAEASLNPWPLILVLYGAVAFLLLLRLGVGLVRGWALRRRADGLGRGYCLSGEVTTPVVFGSTVILPRDSVAWTEAKRVAVLAHELSHVARGDFYVQLISALHRAIFWFSPMSWLLHRELAALAELASDDAAAQTHGDRLSYAEILMEVAKDARPMASGVAMARGAALSRRIARLLSAAAFPVSLSHRQRAMIGGAGTLAVLGVLTATAATSSVARTVDPKSATPGRFAPLMATLAKLDRGPAQIADAVGGLLQAVAPTVAAAPEAPPASEPNATALPASAYQGGPGTYISGGKGWGAQELINTGPGEGVVTKGEIADLPPQQAGDRILGQLNHGPIARVAIDPNFGPVRLLEEWTRVPEGCQRLGWTAHFLVGVNATPESAWLRQAYSFGQIATAGPDGCASARYALLGNIDRDNGFKALAVFEEAAAGKRAVTFECTSTAGRDICASPQTIRAEMLRPVHRLVHVIGGRYALTYNSRESAGPLMYMTVSFDTLQPDRIRIEDLPFPAENRTGIPAPPPPVFDTRPRLGPPPAPSPAMTVLSSTRGNNEEAVRLLTPMAEMGDAMAMIQLAGIYLQGRGGVAQDHTKAMAYYRQAADVGDLTSYGGGSTISGHAMFQLAFAYEHGVGVPRDDVEAAKWWRRWARTGDVRAGTVLAQRGLQP